MKNLKITVNGKTYDVQVEETGTVSAPAAAQVNSIPAVSVAPAPAAPVPAAPPQPSASSDNSQPVEAAETIESPMPGTIINVKVKAGDSVKKGDVLVVLEAMKMENDITALRDATIVKVHISQGEMVNSGDALISIN